MGDGLVRVLRVFVINKIFNLAVISFILALPPSTDRCNVSFCIDIKSMGDFCKDANKLIGTCLI